MAPTSPSFLFVFLPVVLTVYWLLPAVGARNAFLLIAGLAFYWWGQGAWCGVLIVCVLSSYLLGLWLGSRRGHRNQGWAVALAAAIVLAPLAIAKYAGFTVQTVNGVARWFGGTAFDVPSWTAPAGISFFTFMALTYLFSVARGEARAQRNILPVALHTSFFPVVLAGPIIRYGSVLPQILERTLDVGLVAQGARRFVHGLAKKVLIADTLAAPAGLIFGLPYWDLSPAVAWFGLVCYTLQIFIDFSAYSDMAIGIGAMLGFRVPENFDAPYAARSIRAFWTRWHITLSTWFRDYVFLRILYPAGRAFERMGARAARSDFWAYAAAAMTTMLLIGLWHGAAWTFVAWGFYHGALLVLERTRVGKWIAGTPRPLQHAYLVLAVMAGWVLFRLETLRQAGWFFAVLAGLTGGSGAPVGRYAGGDVLLAIAVGLVLSSNVAPVLRPWAQAWLQRAAARAPVVVAVGDAALQAAMLLLSLAWLSGGTFTPFIYFRF
jgi:alginate O-acetyltransferase complex protein AlgI